MSQTVISKRISSIQSDIQRLNSSLEAMSTIDIRRYPDNYESLSIEAALSAEKIACQLRTLIYATTHVKAAGYLPMAASAQGIEVRDNKGIIEITLPSLLPKRKQRASAEYLLAPFNAALSEFTRVNPVPRFPHCTICFSSVYDRSLSTRRIRDYDNLELKQFLDTAASYLLVDDTGLLCDAYNTTELGDADCTLISIMDSGRFPAWLTERYTTLQGITSL